MIRPVQPVDLDSVVRIHLSSFQGFFLSVMGASFLREFYRAILLDESNIALLFVSEQEGEICGFVVGSTNPFGFYRRTVLKYWHRFLLASLIPVLENPKTILRLLRRLFMVTQAEYTANEALLMSIAVAPQSEGRGIGRRLIEAFLLEAKRRGATSVSLITDATNNERANRLYIQSGFAYSRSFITPEARQMNEYRKCLV